MGDNTLRIQQATFANWACYSHSPSMTVVRSPCFGILPLVVDGIIAGCPCLDSASDSFVFDGPKGQALLELRKFAVMTIARTRNPWPLAVAGWMAMAGAALKLYNLGALDE